MTTQLNDLLTILDVRELGNQAFEGAPTGRSNARAFGGHVIGQALAAAARTVESTRLPHSLHAYFLRPGASAEPIRYEVDEVREGRSFSTRTVSALQRDKKIFTMNASFHAIEDGLEHQLPAPDVPSAEGIDPASHDITQWPDIYKEWSLLEFRHVTDPVPGLHRRKNSADLDESDRAQIWVRTAEPLPADPLLHACIMACVSDLTLLSIVLKPHGIPPRHEGYMVASVDHSMWFHRPVSADHWWLYDQRTPSAGGALGLAEGRIYTADGQLAVSVVQEGLIRKTN